MQKTEQNKEKIIGEDTTDMEGRSEEERRGLLGRDKDGKGE